jgi:hypothetical protein
VDSVHRAVDCGATGPPWTGGHCRVRELTGARPPARRRGRGRRAGELNSEVTAGREAVEGHLTGGVGFSNGGGAQERRK